jgi:hypothetical protein
MSVDDWRGVHELASRSAWIMDGDLGPYDVVEPRLMRAVTVVVLDLAVAVRAAVAETSSLYVL